MSESSDDRTSEILERFELTKNIAAQKGRELGIPCEEYLIGIMRGEYPPITEAEFDAERRRQSEKQDAGDETQPS
jgi:hypothetical protein